MQARESTLKLKAEAIEKRKILGERLKELDIEDNKLDKVIQAYEITLSYLRSAEEGQGEDSGPPE